jgi:hypothetical protein
LTGQHPDFRPTEFRDLLSLSPSEFESWCAAALERGGYGKVTVTTKGPKGGDGGVDLRVHDREGKVMCLGQCKRWTMRPAAGLMHVIRELSGSMADFRVGRGLLLITVPVTEFERRKALRLGIDVIDPGGLRAMLRHDGTAVQTSEPAVCAGPSSTVTATGPVHVDVQTSGDLRGSVLRWAIRLAAIAAVAILAYVYRDFIKGAIGVVALAMLGPMRPVRRRKWCRYRYRYGRRRRSF